MIIPVRCFTCNKLIGNKWTTLDKNGYEDLIKSGKSPKEALDMLDIKRMCCRRMFITHVDSIKKINF